MAIAAIMIFNIGFIKGQAEFHASVEPANFRVSTSAITAESPVAFTKFRTNVHITAYSSRPEETDDTPFITASGKHVAPGIAAANWLPFGTKIRIPAIFGDRVFVIEDRMHRRNAEKLDIWFSSTKDALRFGVKHATVEIL